ncbi:MAG: hypothetical protein AAB503_01710 [Patescibacteria group bacterium]
MSTTQDILNAIKADEQQNRNKEKKTERAKAKKKEEEKKEEEARELIFLGKIIKNLEEMAQESEEFRLFLLNKIGKGKVLVKTEYGTEESSEALGESTTHYPVNWKLKLHIVSVAGKKQVEKILFSMGNTRRNSCEYCLFELPDPVREKFLEVLVALNEKKTAIKYFHEEFEL